MKSSIVSYIKKQCRENNVGLKFLKSPLIRHCEDSYVGEFLDNPLKITVATGRKKEEWIPVLAHEFCHFKQFKQRSKKYLKTSYKDGRHAQMLFHDYVNKHPAVSLDDGYRSFLDVLDLEIDCEIRTNKLLRKFKEFDDGYIQEANCYLFFIIFQYHWRDYKMKEVSTDQIKLIRESMPSKFLKRSQYLKMFQKYEFLFVSSYLYL